MKPMHPKHVFLCALVATAFALCAMVLSGCGSTPIERVTNAEHTYAITMDALNSTVERGLWTPSEQEKAAIAAADRVAFDAIQRAKALAEMEDPGAEQLYLSAMETAMQALIELQAYLVKASKASAAGEPPG